MLAKPKEPRIPLPKGWQCGVKSAVFHSIALAHYAFARARAGRRQHQCPGAALSAENDQLRASCRTRLVDISPASLSIKNESQFA